MICSRSGMRRAVAIVGLLLLAACGTTVAISARFPARYAEATNIRKLVVGRFEGSGGGEFADALETHLAGATFDGQRYFTLASAAGGREDGGRAVAAGRAAGAQGVVFGSVSTDFNTERYDGSERRCVVRDGKKCRQYQTFTIACYRRSVQVSASPRMVRVANGQLIYSAQKAAGRQTRWCQNGSQSQSDMAMLMGARAEILEDIRRDIGPYNAVLNATLKTAADGLSGEAKTEFANAVKFASTGDMGQACQRWEAVNTAQPNNLATVYNLGVCAESFAAYPKATVLYRQAQSLAGKPDADITASLTRVQNLAQASGQLAQEQARREAAAEEERQRQAAASRAQATAAAQLARDQQQALAKAKAAEAERQRAARAKYGAAAPAILAGKVTIGMTMAQVRAARGPNPTIRKLSPTEEMWIYGSQRIVFINGKVTTVR